MGNIYLQLYTHPEDLDRTKCGVCVYDLSACYWGGGNVRFYPYWDMLAIDSFHPPRSSKIMAKIKDLSATQNIYEDHTPQEDLYDLSDL